MKLTPLDIHHKEFRRAIRGYSEEEVDVFLDQVAEEFERVFKENIDLKEQIEGMNNKVKQYEGVESTLQRALLTAQQAADDVQNSAQKESVLIIKDAELKAKEIIQQVLTEKQNLQNELSSLGAAERDFRDKFKHLLNQYLDVLNKSDISMPGEAFSAVEMPAEPDVTAVLDETVSPEPSAEPDIPDKVEAEVSDIPAEPVVPEPPVAAEPVVENPAPPAFEAVVPPAPEPEAPEVRETTPAPEAPASSSFELPDLDTKVNDFSAWSQPEAKEPETKEEGKAAAPTIGTGESFFFNDTPDVAEPPKQTTPPVAPWEEPAAPVKDPESDISVSFGSPPASPPDTAAVPKDSDISPEAPPVADYAFKEPAPAETPEATPSAVTSFFDDDLGVDEEER